MKGLLIKDLYMIKNYCKLYVLVLICFSIGNVFANNSIAFSYTYMIASMVVITLMSYDENNGFNEYAYELPIDAKKIVSCKYILGLIINCLIILINALLSFVMKGSIDLHSLLLGICICCISFSITIPVYFRFGVQKGRIAYYLMIGFTVGIAVYLNDSGLQNNSIQMGEYIIVVLAIAIFILSWFLSTGFYTLRMKKER